MIRGLSILLLCLLLGEGITLLFSLPIPGSILGMLLLVFSLQTGWIKLSYVKPISDLMISYMGLFFVPAGVALINYFDIIEKEWIPISVVFFVTTVLVLIVTALIHQWIRKK